MGTKSSVPTPMSSTTLNIVTNLVLLQAIISLARSTIRLLVSNNACFDLMFGLQGHKWCQPTLLVKLGSSFTGNLLLRWTLSLYGPYSFNGNLNNKENKECYIYIYIYIFATWCECFCLWIISVTPLPSLLYFWEFFFLIRCIFGSYCQYLDFLLKYIFKTTTYLLRQTLDNSILRKGHLILY